MTLADKAVNTGSANATMCHLRARLDSAAGPLAQGGFVEGAQERSRWLPSAALDQKARTGIDDVCVISGGRKDGCHHFLDERVLLFAEGTRIQAALVIEGEHRVGFADHPDRRPIDLFDDKIGHTYPMARERQERMVGRFTQHVGKGGVRQPIELVRFGDEEASAAEPG